MSKATNDPPLTEEQLKLISKLSEADLNYIDSTLLSNISSQWRKVARVIGTTMNGNDNKITGIPEWHLLKILTTYKSIGYDWCGMS